MVIGVVEVGLIMVQVMVVEKMNFVVDFAGIVDKEKIVEDMVVGMNVGRVVDMVVGMNVGRVFDMVVGRVVGRFDSHKHVLANLEKVGFGYVEEARSAKA